MRIIIIAFVFLAVTVNVINATPWIHGYLGGGNAARQAAKKFGALDEDQPFCLTSEEVRCILNDHSFTQVD